VKYLKDLVFEFKETMPIIEALGNKLLEDIHWEEIKEKLGMVNFPLEEKQFSLGELVNYGVAKYSEDVVNISVTAT
jgi:dynein heavy chain, axonemal